VLRTVKLVNEMEACIVDVGSPANKRKEKGLLLLEKLIT